MPSAVWQLSKFALQISIGRLAKLHHDILHPVKRQSGEFSRVRRGKCGLWSARRALIPRSMLMIETYTVYYSSRTSVCPKQTNLESLKWPGKIERPSRR